MVVGHGGIVPTFLDAARGIGHEVVAVVGRDPGRAGAFAKAHGIAETHHILEATAEATLSAGWVDAAYVATPHSAHRDATLALLGAGVPVLCEKPMAVNAGQVSEMVAAARATDTFLMEAMWTLHLPVHDEVRAWIKSGRIGAPKLVEASFGFRTPYEPDSRLWSRDLAGGSLLDLGIYPLTLVDMVFGGLPDVVSAVAELSPEAVDAHLAMVLAYPGGGLARLGSAINTRMSAEARIVGESGTITIPAFWSAERAFLESPSDSEEVHRPHRVNGFEYQILEAARCLRAGVTESPVVGWAWSLRMAGLMDAIRAQIGVHYPADAEVS